MTTVSRTTATARYASTSSQPTLRMGSKGASVSQLQQKLKNAGFNPGPVDGDFGPKTLAAVKAFQRSKGIGVDGIVGPITWGKLGVSGSSGPAPAPGGGSHVSGYVNGVARNITVSGIPNGKTMRTDAAAAYNRMYAAARRDGVTLTPVSGFRTMEQQRYLYSLYLQGRGNLAARPGYSNHQGGIAVDISTNSAVNSWLSRHASQYGFRRTVPSEIWHFEYRP
ncbi:MAG: peptidoglycan-binding protein [Myxococcaceae bacterium]